MIEQELPHLFTPMYNRSHYAAVLLSNKAQSAFNGTLMIPSAKELGLLWSEFKD